MTNEHIHPTMELFRDRRMIVVTGGGTGGHIFPTIAVIGELKRRGYEEILWIGSKNGSEREWAKKVGVRYHGILAGKLRRYFSLRNFVDLFKVFWGTAQSFFLFCRKKPQIIFSKGGFVSVPPVLASRTFSVPVVTHESDTVPGLATRIISRCATAVCVSFQSTADFFPGRDVFFTGNPIREVVLQGSAERGVSWLGFEGNLPIVFAVGGSTGASAINETVWKMLEEGDLSFNLVHQCGRGNLNEGLSGRKRYRQFEFLDEQMGDVLQAASVVVSRAGAGALYEIGLLKKASILIPLPLSASRGEQIENARYYEEHGACVVIPQESLTPELLKLEIEELLSGSDRRERVGQAARQLVRENASEAIAGIIDDIIAC
jgi:UDP-N-acetylglucosamine--N-acetylmuramyl-(pentapeptide) pyrophosphoryl-undecaprenol N-acetylglucosamine transferase